MELSLHCLTGTPQEKDKVSRFATNRTALFRRVAYKGISNDISKETNQIKSCQEKSEASLGCSF
ncbi:hypothetical protein DKK66_18655 [Aquitalea sp. USM4]|nr:hypothetical protein DKK66_18655 [Aquitalea sp. USM4]